MEFDVVFLADTHRNILSIASKSYFFLEYLESLQDEDQSSTKAKNASFHIKEDISSLSKNNSPKKKHEEKEKYESARILYVALTRAIKRIYIVLNPNSYKPDAKTNSYHKWICDTILEKTDSDILDQSPDFCNFNDNTITIKDESQNDLFKILFTEKIPTDTSPKAQNKAGKLDKKNNLSFDRMSQIFLLDEPKNLISGYKFTSASSLIEQNPIDPTKKNTDEYENEDRYYFKDNISDNNFYFSEQISSKDLGVLIHKVFEWIDFSSCHWSEEQHQTLLSTFRVSLQHHDFLLSQIKNMLSAFKKSVLLNLITESVVLGREVSFSGFYQANKDLKIIPQEVKQIAVGYIDLILYVEKQIQLQDHIFKPGIYIIDYKTNKIFKNINLKDFKTNLLTKYKKSMELYKKIMQNYYEKYQIYIALYHTSTGELWFY